MLRKERPFITIGIPTYNRADGFLRQAMQSALAQTYAEMEIVVSDNASTDHTEELIKGFADQRVRYFKHEENIGLKNNFNYCVEKSKGDYFLLLCDDDLIDPDLLTTCMKKIDYKTDVGVILSGIRLIDKKGEMIRESPNKAFNCSLTELFFKWFEDKIPLYLPSTLYNTKGLRQIGMFHSKTNMFLDVVATVKIAKAMGRRDVEEVKSSFRRHDTNTGGSPERINLWSEDCLYLLDVMCGLVDQGSKDQLRRKGLWYFCRKNYRLARTIENPAEKMRTFSSLHTKYENVYSPWKFVFDTKVKPRIRRITAKFIKS